MVDLVDTICVIIPLAIGIGLFSIYYRIFVVGYVRRIKELVANGVTEEANSMMENAVAKQPKRMKRMLRGIDGADRIIKDYEEKRAERIERKMKAKRHKKTVRKMYWVNRSLISLVWYNLCR